MMSLQQFNQAPSVDLETTLKHCVPIQHWADAIIAQRPFASVAQLLAYAEQQAEIWLWADVEAALAHHPRIGERQPQTANLSQVEHGYSTQEQALIYQDHGLGLERLAVTQQALFTGNQAYEQKFGFIFLIKASGLNQQQVLAALALRLQHDLDVEKHIVQQQLKYIALCRLTQELQA